MGANAQVALEKFARYFDVEVRTQFTFDAPPIIQTFTF
jgi:glutamate/tyrosine decarboxylase-like PLP-dependent enzyme